MSERVGGSRPARRARLGATSKFSARTQTRKGSRAFEAQKEGKSDRVRFGVRGPLADGGKGGKGPGTARAGLGHCLAIVPGAFRRARSGRLAPSGSVAPSRFPRAASVGDSASHRFGRVRLGTSAATLTRSVRLFAALIMIILSDADPLTHCMRILLRAHVSSPH